MKKATISLLGAFSVALLVGCSTPNAAVTPPVDEQPTATAAPSATPTVTPSPAPTNLPTVEPTPEPTTSPELPTTDPRPLPTDCRAILTDDVLAQLQDAPLNDPAFGPAGSLEDGSLLCIWADPRADVTSLVTRIHKVTPHEGDVLLGEARDTGLECTELEIAVRCSIEGEHPQYPVLTGRTLYMQSGIVIDTSWANLAPAGYTNAIIAAIWPENP